MNWYMKLQRWQKGAVIGALFGVLLICYIATTYSASKSHHYDINIPEIIFLSHAWMVLLLSNLKISNDTINIILIFIFIFCFYSAFGALLGVAHQDSDFFPGWAKSGGLLGFYIFFCFINVYFGMWAKYS